MKDAESSTNDFDSADIPIKFLEWVNAYVSDVSTTRRFVAQLTKVGENLVWVECGASRGSHTSPKFYDAKELFQLFQQEVLGAFSELDPIPTWVSIRKRLEAVPDDSHYSSTRKIIAELEALRISPPEKLNIKTVSGKNLAAYKSRVAQCEARNNQINTLLRSVVEFMGRMDFVPPANRAKVWDMAWERGHSEGYYRVFEELIDITYLFKV